MKAEFESALEELKLVFPKVKGILIVILYGSVARGDFSRRHSDLDLLVVLNEEKKKEMKRLKKKIKDLVRSVCVKWGVRAHLEFQGTDIRNEDRTLLEKIIEEGKVIYSSGVWFFNNQLIGLKQYIIYSFSAKNSDKRTLFSKTLHGKKSWYYKGKKKVVKEYPGIIDDENIILIGKGGLLVSKEKQNDIEITFQKFSVDYKIKKIVYA